MMPMPPLPHAAMALHADAGYLMFSSPVTRQALPPLFLRRHDACRLITAATLRL